MVKVSFEFGRYGSAEYTGEQAKQIIAKIKEIKSDSLVTIELEDHAKHIINIRNVLRIGIRE